jgi:hypothetical protein
VYPEYWGFSWCRVSQGDADAALTQLGLSGSDLRPLQAWVEAEFERGGVGFPGVFLQYAVAVEFAERFMPNAPGVKLLGIGLPHDRVEAFLSEGRPGADEGAPGIYRAVESGAPLAGGGTPLGFEPLGYDHGGFHSFVCNSLEEDYSNELGLTLNEHGRFADLSACQRAVEYTCLDTTGAEPALWQPWLVIDYPHGRASDRELR